MTYTELAALAVKAIGSSYAPYSHFNVGAALLCADGTVYLGANIENAAYSVTCCAERVALFAAVRDGKRDFKAIAIAGGLNGEIKDACAPCGTCRQALSEFCSRDFEVVLALPNGEYELCTLGELLPKSFGPAMLEM